MPQVVVGVMPVSPSNHVLGRTEHPGNVVDGHAQLEEPGRAGKAKDVGSHVGAEARELTCRTPSPALLRGQVPLMQLAGKSMG